MNSLNRHLYIDFSVGESGGSTNQPCESNKARRGLCEEQSDPLVLWWVRLIKAEYSADGLRHQSYRRSRWGQEATPKAPGNPYLNMPKEVRLLNFTLSALVLGLTASLNMVAQAQTAAAGDSVGQTAVIAAEIPYAERFSKMKDFIGRHNQYLDLSKLNEFKWTDDGQWTAPVLAPKHKPAGAFSMTSGDSSVQPQAVNQKKQASVGESDAKLTQETGNAGDQSAKREAGQ